MVTLVLLIMYLREIFKEVAVRLSTINRAWNSTMLLAKYLNL
jgi:hypothetical protein